MGSLKSKVKNGLTWSFVDNILLRAVTFIVMIFLTRILEPKDFGLIAIVTVFISLGNALIEGGLGNSIIRDNTAGNEDFNAVFYGNLIISTLLYPILYFSAPLIALFFENSLVTNLIRVYGVTFIISAFYYVQHSILIKQVLFQKIALYNTPAVIIGACIGILCAYNELGVWSLVYMQIATLLLKSLIYWFASAWRPRIGFSMNFLKKHIKFGYRLMVISVIDAISSEINSFIIGKNFNISTLGFYNQSKTFRNYPINLLSTIITSVTYPLLATIQDNNKRFKELYSKILQSMFFLVTLFMIGLVVVAKPLFILLYTNRWLEAVPYFQLLAVAGILTPIHAFNTNLFKICNRTDLFLKIGILKIILVITSLSIGVYFGIYGLLCAIIVSSLLGIFINTYHSKNLINYSTLDQLIDMYPIILYAIVSYLLGSYSVSLLENKSNSLQLLTGSLVTFSVFIATAAISKSRSLNEVKELIKLFTQKI